MPNEIVQVFYGLNLSQRLYATTDNLSKTLQQENMSALRGKELSNLTVKTLDNMRNERHFSLLYENILSASKIEEIAPHLQESKDNPTTPSYIALEETQKQQLQRIIRKTCTIITNQLTTKLLIPLLTPSKIDSINQHFSCLLKWSSYF